MPSESDVTVLLNQWAAGDQAALDALMPLVYRELHKLAKRHMGQQQPGHTLQTTAVIHEAYLKLASGAQPPSQDKPWNNRTHFFAVAAKAMRQILVDHARAQLAGKRGGDAEIVPLDEWAATWEQAPAQLIALNQALEALAKADSRKGQVVELRYFGGLSVDETAQALNVSVETVARDWKFALAFLKRELQAPGR